MTWRTISCARSYAGGVPNRRAVVLALRVRNNDRNLQVQLDPVGGLNATVQWAAAPPGPGPPTPVPPPPHLVRRATDGIVVARGRA